MNRNVSILLLIIFFSTILFTSCGSTKERLDAQELVPEYTGDISIMDAYYGKYRQLAERYGTHALHDVYDQKRDYGGHSYLDGVCIVDLMDFNGDGIQDLFVVYATVEMDNILIDNYDLEIFNFPGKNTYQMEVWTYYESQLMQLLYEPCVSLHDTTSYSPHNPKEVVVLNRQFSVTVFENEAGLPVIQLYHEDTNANIREYQNIYYLQGEIVKDKLTNYDSVFSLNASPVTWEVWSEKVADYDTILLSALLAQSWFGASAYLSDVYGMDYNYTLLQTEKVIRALRDDNGVPEESNWFIAQEEYLSLYMRQLHHSNVLLCEWEDADKVFFDHHYNLYDMDQNGIPELILYEGSSGAGMHFHFYTVIDGQIISCGSYGRTSLSANGEAGLIAYFGRMGGYHIDLLTLHGTDLEATLIAGNYLGDAEEYPELGDLGYEGYKYLPFCPPAIPLRFYTYNQEFLLF